jgi:hypothetical protein
MKSYRFFILLLFCFGACSKTETAEDKFLVRVKNDTSEDFKEVIIGNQSYFNVGATVETDYQVLDNFISAPEATLITNTNDTIHAGYYYFDYIEWISSGKYTLRIFKDTATLSDYNCEYIKN